MVKLFCGQCLRINRRLAEVFGYWPFFIFSMQLKSDYSEKNIQVLEGLRPVRKRPAMYIGSTDLKGVHHCVAEIIDNSIDENLAGHAKNVWISLKKDGSITVVDDGRGIPVGIMPRYKKSALEIVMTKLHAGGKFDSKAYKVSGGLHGVGASVVNALSSYMRVEVYKKGKVYFQEYKRGKPVSKIVEKKGTRKGLKSGTLTTFIPDKKIFSNTRVSFEAIKKSIRERAYLVPGFYFHLEDKREEVSKEAHFYFEGGIRALVEKLTENKNPLIEPIVIKKSEKLLSCEVALSYTDTLGEAVESFVNVINTKEGGTHLTGFRAALTRAINDYGKKSGAFKNGNGITGDDTREGLTAVIAIRMPGDKAQFEGQTKSKLGNAEVQPFVQAAVKDGLDRYLEEHPRQARRILEKVILASKARLAAKAAKDAIIRKGALEGSSLPGKLADCQSNDPEKSELFIVEGDSAGGSAKQGRDRKFQAILPLGGKILNTERARLDKIVEFNELKDLIIALGMGIGESLTPEKLRYKRIIIMCDADVDGEHIVTLLLTFFYRHLPYIIEKGYLYIAQPPLFKITSGKNSWYIYNEEKKDELIKKILEKKGKDKDVKAEKAGIAIQRYKGLGEMNPEQLWKTTMNPEKRILKKVTIEDGAEADRVFTTLMGSDVPPRKRFIQTHAKMATLDI